MIYSGSEGVRKEIQINQASINFSQSWQMTSQLAKLHSAGQSHNSDQIAPSCMYTHTWRTSTEGEFTLLVLTY